MSNLRIEDTEIGLLYEKRILNQHYKDAETDIEFEIGGVYPLTDGNQFKVDRIELDDTDVQYYIVGTIIGGPNDKKIFERPLKKMAKTVKEAMPKDSKPKKYNFGEYEYTVGDCWLLGFIAANGLITIQTPAIYASDVEKQYMEATGEQLDEATDSYLISEKNKWFPQLRVYLNRSSDKLAGMGSESSVELHPKKNGGYEINNTPFVWGLFRYGYRVGKNGNRLDEIMKEITHGDKARENAFIDGALS